MRMETWNSRFSAITADFQSNQPSARTGNLPLDICHIRWAWNVETSPGVCGKQLEQLASSWGQRRHYIFSGIVQKQSAERRHLIFMFNIVIRKMSLKFWEKETTKNYERGGGVLLRSISHGCVNKPEEQSIGVLFVCFLSPSFVSFSFPVMTKTNSSAHRSANLVHLLDFFAQNGSYLLVTKHLLSSLWFLIQFNRKFGGISLQKWLIVDFPQPSDMFVVFCDVTSFPFFSHKWAEFKRFNKSDNRYV